MKLNQPMNDKRFIGFVLFLGTLTFVASSSREGYESPSGFTG
jgi:hypothetical protein